MDSNKSPSADNATSVAAEEMTPSEQYRAADITSEAHSAENDAYNNNDNHITNQIAAAADIISRETGIFGTAMIMSCNIMGGSLLVLPDALSHASLIPGVILVILFGAASALTATILASCAQRHHRFTYKSLCQAVIPSDHAYLSRVMDWILLLYTYGALIEYGRIVADSMPNVVLDLFHAPADSFVTTDWFWLILACVAFFPLTSLRNLAELSWVSILGVATMVYALFLVIAYFFVGRYRSGGEGSSLVDKDVTVFNINVGIIYCIPMLNESFNCHYNVVNYYHELKDRSVKCWNKVLLLVFPLTISLYTAFAVLGYLTFGNARVAATEGNIMNAFSVNDLAANISRLGLFVHFLTAYPIVALGCRNTLNEVLFQTPRKATWIHITEAFIIVASTSALAYCLPGMSVIVSIIGSLFGVSIVYTIPGLIYIGTFKKLPWREHFSFSRARWSAAKETLLNRGADDEEKSSKREYLVEEGRRSGGSKTGTSYGGVESDEPPKTPDATRVNPERYLYVFAHVCLPLGFFLTIIGFALAIVGAVR